MDRDGYPTDEELDAIQKWGNNDFAGLLNFVRDNAWNEEFGKWTRIDRKYSLVTGGWSGNEEVLDAPQKNRTFWLNCWRETHRGGMDKFEIPELQEG